MACQIADIEEQFMNKCAQDLDDCLQKVHHVGPYTARRIRYSPVGTTPFSIHQKNNFCLGGAVSFETVCHQKEIVSGTLCDVGPEIVASE